MNAAKGSTKRLLSVLVTFVLMLTSCLPAYAVNTADMAERQTVRVGFFAWDGYHVQDENGIRSGYGYDFLKMAESYHNWKFAYVGYDKSWSDMLQMLDDGDIDMLTFAAKTPEREAKYLYSDNPIGTGAIVLTVKQGDSRYTAGAHAEYNGMRVGIVRDSTHQQTMDTFAQDNGFSYTPVYFDSLETMKQALQTGTQIDAMVNTSNRTFDNETILEQIDPADFYVIVRKENTALMEEINDAMAQMDINNPGWRVQLKNTYFSDSGGEELVFSKNEQQYLQALQEEGRTLKVVTNPDLAPYSYFENGEAKGIIPDIFREMAKRIGLNYEFIPMQTYPEYHAYIMQGQDFDIDLTCFSSYGLAEYHNLDLTNSYMTTTMALVSKQAGRSSVNKLAVVRDFANTSTYNRDLMEQADCVEYDTEQECIQAVLDGTADGTYLYTYAAQKAVEGDFRNQLHDTIMPEYEMDLSIGVVCQENYALVSILNKAIKSVQVSFVQLTTQEHISDIGNNASFLALLYDNPMVANVLLVGALLLLFVLGIYIYKTNRAKKEHQQAQELARFKRYVCETCTLVMEVNLDTLQCVAHTVENGELVSRTMPCEFANFNNDDEKIYQEDFEVLTSEYQVNNFYQLFEQQNGQMYFEARCKETDGTYRWYSYSIKPIPKSKEHPHNFILFKKDIDSVKRQETEQRRTLEEALASARSASTAKGQFLSRMSHEIRTPLNAVIGYMDIARDSGDNPEKMMHCIENSDLAARHLLSIINDVLDMSSIESGKMKIAHEDFDLKKQLTTITTLFYNQAKAKNVQFDVILCELTDEWVTGDGLRLNQILMNLLSNAVKFTPENGKITLTVTQLHAEEQKVFFTFSVADTGIGMSEEYQKRLFQPFEQENATTAQKHGGSGLGLSITFHLINMMGGSIDVHSKVEKGSTFIVSLPFDRCKQRGGVVQQDYSKVRVLIVDDDNDTCAYMKNLLKRCKVKCDIAHSGAQAIQQIKRRSGTEYAYDMCIMDWNMPQMNGVETARQIRSECHSEIPIIIATAYDVTAFEDEAKAAGVTHIISKPLFQSTVFDLLVSTYGKYQPVSQQPQTTFDLKGKHILLVEDNEMNMEIASDVLSHAGIVLTPAGNGQEAVDIFLAAPVGSIDAILMDIQMPVLDGYGATEKIRSSHHPEAKTIPIIAMTANAFHEDIAAALASGMNDHISKPIDYDKLFAALSRLTNKEENNHE